MDSYNVKMASSRRIASCIIHFTIYIRYKNSLQSIIIKIFKDIFYDSYEQYNKNM